MLTIRNLISPQKIFSQKGFSLVEILIVVAIIALLSAIAIPNLIRAKITANEAVAQSTLKAISSALENYATINSEYPLNTNALIGPSLPYLTKDYFVGDHQGYNYVAILTAYTYTVTASPARSISGNRSFTISTGAVLVVN